jgi:hypothetical protein
MVCSVTAFALTGKGLSAPSNYDAANVLCVQRTLLVLFPAVVNNERKWNYVLAPDGS